MNRFWRRLLLTLDMIKFEHSVFALPFALTGALLAWRDCGFQVGGLGWRFLWILVAMVAARSAAMAFNRLLDADIDARNRRTANRHLPAGLLSERFAWGFTCVASLVFLWAARELGGRRALDFGYAFVGLGTSDQLIAQSRAGQPDFGVNGQIEWRAR